MVRLIKYVLAINTFAAFVVWLLSNYIEFFATTHIIDYLFFMVIIIWMLAKLSWEGGIYSKTYDYDDRVTAKAQSMVSGHDFALDKQDSARQNYQFGLILFVSGLPAFVTCIILHYFA